MINNSILSDYRQTSPCELAFADSNTGNSHTHALRQEHQYDENLLNSIVRMENYAYEGPSATSLDLGYRRISPDKRIISIQDISTKITERRTLKAFEDHGADIKPREKIQKISDWAKPEVLPKKGARKAPEKHIDSFGFHNNSVFGPFECKMERKEPYFKLNPNINPKLTFVDPIFLERGSRQMIEPVDLGVAIKKITKLTENQKIYRCEICLMEYSNPFALGGHKARLHPGSSEAYRKRIYTLKIRQSEREKRKCLNRI